MSATIADRIAFLQFTIELLAIVTMLALLIAICAVLAGRRIVLQAQRGHPFNSFGDAPRPSRTALAGPATRPQRPGPFRQAVAAAVHWCAIVLGGR